MTEKVVITGLGAVTPVGNDPSAFWESLTAGKSGIAEVTHFDPSIFSTRFAGELKEFDLDAYMDKKQARRADPYTRFAIAASKQALAQSGLDMSENDGNRIGAIIGSGIGGITTWEANHRALIERGPGKVSPFFIPMMIADMASGQVSMQLGARGSNFATVSACASGAHAIGEAYEMIRRGQLDAAFAGGAEAPIAPTAMAGFASMRALSSRNENPAGASRPFDLERDGFVMGEGAGVLVLEAESHARERGADILAELGGYGSTADAHHMTAPAPGGEGAVRAIRQALDRGRVDPENVGYINAHGTSTQLNDRFETMAIREVFSAHADRLVVSSTKSMTGHLLGAAGAIEAIASVFVVRSGVIPPTINLENPDPECDLDYCPNEAREVPVDVVVSNSLGFGGHNVTLLIRKYGTEE